MAESALPTTTRLPADWRLAGGLAAIVVLAHVITAVITPYEIHRDEFLYFAMGEHLRLFAMDFPPMIAILARAARGLLGDALWSLRLAPAPKFSPRQAARGEA